MNLIDVFIGSFVLFNELILGDNMIRNNNTSNNFHNISSILQNHKDNIF